MNGISLSIGDELLSGITVNTNAATIARRIFEAGHTLTSALTVRDDVDEIRSAIDNASRNADFVIVTGGLGPTEDDRTSYAARTMLQTELVHDKHQEELIRERFGKLGRVPNHLSLNQAMVPAGCDVINNYHGTAPGLRFTWNDASVFLMPGVPHEMREMLDTVIERYLHPVEGRTRRSWLIHGIPESDLALSLAKTESLLDDHLKLSYLPSQGIIRLGLLALTADTDLMRRFNLAAEQIEADAAEWILAETNGTPADVVGELLEDQKGRLAVAESCTGGLIGSSITERPGSGEYFLGGIISYSNDVKMSALGVRSETVERVGAVSREVAEEMASGVRDRLGADWGLSVTGIAGPTGGSEEKPVGTVWIGLSSERGTRAYHFRFPGSREVVRTYSRNNALALLIRGLTGRLDFAPNETERPE